MIKTMTSATPTSWVLEASDDEWEEQIDTDDSSIIQVSNTFKPTEISGKDVNTKYIYALVNMIPVQHVYFNKDGTPNSLIRLIMSVCNLHVNRYRTNVCTWLLTKYLKLSDNKHEPAVLSVGDKQPIARLQEQAYSHNPDAYNAYHEKISKSKGDNLSPKDKEIIRRLSYGYSVLELQKLRTTNAEEIKEIYLINSLSSKDMDVADAVMKTVINPDHMVYYEHLGLHIFNSETCIWEESDDNHINNAIKYIGIQICELRIKYKDVIKGNEHQEIICKRFNRLVSELRDSKFCKSVAAVILSSLSNKRWFDDAHKITEWVPMNNKQKINWATGKTEAITYKDKYLHCWNACDTKDDGHTAREKEWIDFFRKILCNDDEIVEFLLLVLSIYVSGNTIDKSFVIFHGPGGSNGKSVIIRLLFHLLGGDAEGLADGVYTCMNKDRSTAPELVPLSNRRLCTCDEASNDRALNIPLIKKITGGDVIAGRKLYENKNFNFKSNAHGILTCNHVPKIRDVDIGDKAWLSRLIYFKFMAWFQTDPNEDKPDGVLDENVHTADVTLEEKLTKPLYMNTLLIMLQTRYQAYVAGGRRLTRPGSLAKDGTDLMAGANQLYPFIEECLEIGDFLELTRQEAYDAYTSWGQGPRYKSVVSFGKDMVASFGATVRASGNRRVYKGVRIRPNDVKSDNIIDKINSPSNSIIPLK